MLSFLYRFVISFRIEVWVYGLCFVKEKLYVLVLRLSKIFFLESKRNKFYSYLMDFFVINLRIGGGCCINFEGIYFWVRCGVKKVLLYLGCL